MLHRSFGSSSKANNFPQITLHQGEIEKIFLDAMAERGVQVERACLPDSLEVSSDQTVLGDPQAYAVKVTSSIRCTKSCVSHAHQVVLRHTERPDDQQLETVEAKFVLGSDGLRDLLFISSRNTYSDG